MTEAARLQHPSSRVDEDLNGHVSLDLGTSGLGWVGDRAARYQTGGYAHVSLGNSFAHAMAALA